MEFKDQEQREALVKLMLAARYADKMLSADESDAFAAHVAQLGWDAVTPVEEFLQEATAEVRQALSDEQAKKFFLEANADYFVTPEEKVAAMEHLHAVLAADGIDPAESLLLQQIKAILDS